MDLRPHTKIETWADFTLFLAAYLMMLNQELHTISPSLLTQPDTNVVHSLDFRAIFIAPMTTVHFLTLFQLGRDNFYHYDSISRDTA